MLKGTKKVLIDIFQILYKIIYGFARWVLAFVIVIICAQVFCRNVLRTNIRWNQEVAQLLTIWIAFFGIAIGAEKGLHIVVEVFYDRFPKPLQKAVAKVNQMIVLLVGGFFTVYGIRMVVSTMDSRLPVTKWPSSLMYIMIPVSGLLMIYFEVLDLMGLKKYKKTEPEAEKEEVKEP
ncbi:MAG TPA: TRAP transporter small permease [Candidatus Ventrimonas merdavium]|nr:TRAP transporter small permease [Candidatus Ventrimonas merdavium]